MYHISLAYTEFFTKPYVCHLGPLPIVSQHPGTETATEVFLFIQSLDTHVTMLETFTVCFRADLITPAFSVTLKL